MIINPNNIPQHIAIIMDGNGRWAKQQGQDRLYGHRKGVDSVRSVVAAALDVGVKFLTIYAFSTENWGRPEDEVEGLMELFVSALAAEEPNLSAKNIRIKFIGNTADLSEKVKASINRSENMPIDNVEMTLVIAINYSARWEITQMTRQIATDVKENNITIDKINDTVISNHLTTKGMPDPELIIRTSGECRLSNFLLWQAAYSELYFTDVLWPEFGQDEFFKAIAEFQRRDRRFGLVK